MGKVLGIGILGVVQLAFFVGAAVVAAIVTGSFTLPPSTPTAVVMLVVWFTLGYTLYATTLGFLGSLASRMEEASNATTPVTLVAMASYFIALFAVVDDPSGTIATIATFLPPSRAVRRPAAGRLRRDPAVAGRRLGRPDGPRDLGPVRRRRPGLLGRGPLGRRADEAPRRLAVRRGVIPGTIPGCPTTPVLPPCSGPWASWPTDRSCGAARCPLADPACSSSNSPLPCRRRRSS